MKKIILIKTVLLTAMFSYGQQQPGKYFLYAQGGYKSSGYIKESGLHSIVSEKETAHHKCIVLNAGLLVSVGNKWRVGPAFTYDHFGTKHRSVEFSNLSYMLRCDRIWKTSNSYTLYSGLSLGVRKVRRFDDEIETGCYTTLGYQVYLLGAELKLGSFAIKADAGYGVAGVVSIGGRYHFK